jgi:alpha-1,2-mannosyltransferase
MPGSARTAPTGLRRRPAVAAGLFGLAFVAYALTMPINFWHTDVFGSNWTSWHIATTGRPWIDGTPIPQVNGRGDFLLAIVHTANGHTAFARFPGTVVASLPAYLLFGGDSISVIPAKATAALLTAIAVLLMFLALQRYLTERQALVAALAFGFATPLWTISANLLWPHTITVLGISGMAWAASTGRWWLAGVFGGITLSGRLHTAVIAAILGIGVSIRRRDPSVALRVGTVSGAFLLANCAWCRWVYGSWNPLGGYMNAGLTETAHPYWFSLSNQFGMWLAPDRGILVWTPVIGLLLPALIRSWTALPDWSRSLLVGGLFYTLINAAMNTFTGGDAFYGYRYGLEFLACATPALAMSQAAMGRLGRVLVGPLLALQFFAFLLGAFSDRLWVPKTEAWHRNAFVTGLDIAGPTGWMLAGLVTATGLFFSLRAVRRAAEEDSYQDQGKTQQRVNASRTS